MCLCSYIELRYLLTYIKAKILKSISLVMMCELKIKM